MSFQKIIAGFVLLGLLAGTGIAHAIVPTPGEPQAEPIALVGGTIHVGNGTVLEGATLTFSDGVITGVGSGLLDWVTPRVSVPVQPPGSVTVRVTAPPEVTVVVFVLEPVDQE